MDPQSSATGTAPLYHPLSKSTRETRFIQILPPSSTIDKVECKLITAALSSNPNYAALSYVWGDPNLTKPILINGHIKRVTTNLANFLSQKQQDMMRGDREEVDEEEGRFHKYWIDALCIDQENLEEKSFQLGLMKDIYRSASTVISWLGLPDNRYLDVALSAVRNMRIMLNTAESIEVAEECGQLTGPSNADENEGIGGLVRDMRFWEELVPFLEPFEALLEEKYWTRVWIIQELALGTPNSSILVCGNASLNFADFVKPVIWLDAALCQNLRPSFLEDEKWEYLKDFIAGDDLRRIILIAKYKFSDLRSGLDIIGNFDLTFPISIAKQGLQCTNPRDFVYGVLGLVTSDLVPDYTKSVAEVYMDWFRCLIAEQGLPPTCCLHYAGIGLIGREKQGFDMPSWVPNLPAIEEEFCSWRGDLNSIAFSFGPEFSERCGLDVERGVLSCPGASVCTVEEAVPTATDSARAARDFHRVVYELCMQSMGADDNALDTDGISSLQKIMRTVFEGRDPFSEEYIDFPLPGSSITFPIFLKYVFGSYISNPSTARKLLRRIINASPTDNDSIEESWYFNGEESWLAPFIQHFGKTFFRTEIGSLGLGPPRTEPCDQIFVLEEFNCPVVLRQVEEHWVYIGPCYVPEIGGSRDTRILDELSCGQGDGKLDRLKGKICQVGIQ
ncbi:HET-domain-containing protein [Zopfia rhizophila CBS 207.26]|uniref:HET-domain-containing protein n=1 Tax=Zopfia rhizophila CBS 207.26 TaxID=1314779 RepID=A0A6A6ETY7_9PEZI|nr:HET-domain-containing protein [Zopfia rhizophila CBS 207.26]